MPATLLGRTGALLPGAPAIPVNALSRPRPASSPVPTRHGERPHGRD